MTVKKLKNTIEAILFAAGEPVPVGRLSLVLSIDEDEILHAAEELAAEYEYAERGIRLLRMDDRLQLCSAPEYASVIIKTLEQRKAPTLSSAALETLAIVAYYQPATRALIEKMRGVESSYTVSVLQERGLIAPCGRLEAPGRPTLFATTDAFLRVMGIQSLQDLPPLPEEKGSEGTEQLRRSIAKLSAQETVQTDLFSDSSEEGDRPQ